VKGKTLLIPNLWLRFISYCDYYVNQLIFFFFEGISYARNVPPTSTIAHSQQVRGLTLNQPTRSPLLLVQNQSGEGEGWSGGHDAGEWRMDGGKKKNPKSWCLRVPFTVAY